MFGRIAIAAVLAAGLAASGGFVLANAAGSGQVIAVPEAPPVASVPSDPLPVQALPAPDLPSSQAPVRALAPPGLVRSPMPQSPNPRSMMQKGASASPPVTTGGAGQSPTAQAKAVWRRRGGAVLDMLDKEDGAVTRLSVPVGSSFARGKLRIRIEACMVRPKDAPPDAAVYLRVRRIDETAAGAGQGHTAQEAAQTTPLFAGWLVRSEPGAAVVGDATVTFRVIGCSGH